MMRFVPQNSLRLYEISSNVWSNCSENPMELAAPTTPMPFPSSKRFAPTSSSRRLTLWGLTTPDTASR